MERKTIRAIVPPQGSKRRRPGAGRNEFLGRLDAAEWTPAERANVQTVNEFCAAWPGHDINRIMSFFADNGAYRLMETREPRKGARNSDPRSRPFSRKWSGLRCSIPLQKAPWFLTRELTTLREELCDRGMASASSSFLQRERSWSGTTTQSPSNGRESAPGITLRKPSLRKPISIASRFASAMTTWRIRAAGYKRVGSGYSDRTQHDCGPSSPSLGVRNQGKLHAHDWGRPPGGGRPTNDDRGTVMDTVGSD